MNTASVRDLARACLARRAAVGLVSLLLLAFVPGLMGTADAARSSKPKEIVVVGSKVEKAEGASERPARVVLRVESDHLFDEEELGAIRGAVPDRLDELCGSRSTCTVEDMEAALRDDVEAVLREFVDLEVELSVHIAIRRDHDATSLGIVAPALLGLGILSWRRRSGLGRPWGIPH